MLLKVTPYPQSYKGPNKHTFYSKERKGKHWNFTEGVTGKPKSIKKDTGGRTIGTWVNWKMGSPILRTNPQSRKLLILSRSCWWRQWLLVGLLIFGEEFSRLSELCLAPSWERSIVYNWDMLVTSECKLPQYQSKREHPRMCSLVEGRRAGCPQAANDK